MCERRSNGVKSTLKPQSGSTPYQGSRANSKANPKTIPRSLMFEDTVPAPSSRTTYTSTFRAKTPQESDSTAEQWKAYAEGGAQEDDALVYSLRKEEEAPHLERIRTSTPAPRPSSSLTVNNLIQVSPEKTAAAASRNTDLLIDIDMEPQTARGQPSLPSVPTGSSTVWGGGSAYPSLLD
jgi:helicase required for RNAi-mediated heterochromatin assembly 1